MSDVIIQVKQKYLSQRGRNFSPINPSTHLTRTCRISPIFARGERVGWLDFGCAVGLRGEDGMARVRVLRGAER